MATSSCLRTLREMMGWIGRATPMLNLVMVMLVKCGEPMFRTDGRANQPHAFGCSLRARTGLWSREWRRSSDSQEHPRLMKPRVMRTTWGRQRGEGSWKRNALVLFPIECDGVAVVMKRMTSSPVANVSRPSTLEIVSLLPARGHGVRQKLMMQR